MLYTKKMYTLIEITGSATLLKITSTLKNKFSTCHHQPFYSKNALWIKLAMIKMMTVTPSTILFIICGELKRKLSITFFERSSESYRFCSCAVFPSKNSASIRSRSSGVNRMYFVGFLPPSIMGPKRFLKDR